MNKIITYSVSGKVLPEELDELFRPANMGPYSDKKIKCMLSKSIYVTARHAGHLVGFGRMYTDKGTLAYINNMAVHPDYRRQGIGQKILLKLIDEAGDVNSVFLYTNTADSLYIRNKFQLSEKRLYVYRKKKG